MVWTRSRRGVAVPGEPPRTRRLVRARIGDLRLWLGVVLVAMATLLGAKVLTAGDDSVTVWQASRDLSIGSQAADLEPVSVARVTAGDRYVRTDEPVEGVLRWPVAAGELLPRSALVDPSVRSTRLVTVAVDPLHAPAALRAGDLVDVWATERAAADAGAARPALVLQSVPVAGATDEAMGVGGEVGVVLDVPADLVDEIVSASRSGVLDLTAVPISSQSVTPIASQPAAPISRHEAPA